MKWENARKPFNCSYLMEILSLLKLGCDSSGSSGKLEVIEDVLRSGEDSIVKTRYGADEEVEKLDDESDSDD